MNYYNQAIMSKLFIYWPTAAAVIGTFSLLAAFSIENGRLLAVSFLLFALVLTAMHVYLQRPGGFLQPVGFGLVLVGQFMIVAGFFLTIQGYQAFDPWNTVISPGLHIMMPIGMTLFGFAIHNTVMLPKWSRKLSLIYGIFGCVGILQPSYTGPDKHNGGWDWAPLVVYRWSLAGYHWELPCHNHGEAHGSDESRQVENARFWLLRTPTLP